MRSSGQDGNSTQISLVSWRRALYLVSNLVFLLDISSKREVISTRSSLTCIYAASRSFKRSSASARSLSLFIANFIIILIKLISSSLPKLVLRILAQLSLNTLPILTPASIALMSIMSDSMVLGLVQRFPLITPSRVISTSSLLSSICTAMI